MGNRLIISVTEFRRQHGADISFGFTASDDCASVFDDKYNNHADFVQRFPTKQALIDHVLTLHGFDDIDLNDPVVSTYIEVEGWI